MQSIDTDAQFVYNENGLRGKKTVNEVVTDYILHGKNIVRTPLSKITSTGEIEQRFRLN